MEGRKQQYNQGCAQCCMGYPAVLFTLRKQEKRWHNRQNSPRYFKAEGKDPEGNAALRLCLVVS